MSQVLRFSLKSRILNRIKTIHLYLPTGYQQQTNSYPVLYMHDGHNLFDLSTSAFQAIWNVHETLDQIEENTGLNMIVVGIDCPSDKRFDEYSPWVNPDIRQWIDYMPQSQYGGEGDSYIRWIMEELKPMIDQNYRTIPDETWMAGSSMGAIISLYASVRYSDKIRKIGVFSPAVWFAEKELLSLLETSFSQKVSVFLTIGTNETSNDLRPDFPIIYREGAEKIDAILSQKVLSNYRFSVIEEGIHSEKSWEKQFPLFAKWLLKIE